MKGRPISNKSKEILKLIKQGKRPFEIKNLGFSRETVRYYWRKINYPDTYKKYVKTIQKYNSIRQKNLQDRGNVL